MSEEETEEVIEDDELASDEQIEAVKSYFAAIMAELVNSERFVTWFGCNYEVHKVVNEEEKRVLINLIELPPEEVQRRMIATMRQKVQEDSSKIVTAGANDLAAIEAAAKKRG